MPMETVSGTAIWHENAEYVAGNHEEELAQADASCRWRW